MLQGRDDNAALDAFMAAHTYDALDGVLIKDAKHHPVHARGHRGNAGAYFKFAGQKALEAHVSEIPPGASTKMHRHMCEAIFYVLEGNGHTVFEDDDGVQKKVAWASGDVFATPMMAWHQHVNEAADKTARYLEITTLPLMKAIGAWVIENHPKHG